MNKIGILADEIESRLVYERKKLKRINRNIYDERFKERYMCRGWIEALEFMSEQIKIMVE